MGRSGGPRLRNPAAANCGLSGVFLHGRLALRRGPYNETASQGTRKSLLEMLAFASIRGCKK